MNKSVLLCLTSIIFGCGDDQKIDLSNSVYTKVELYCFCSSYDPANESKNDIDLGLLHHCQTTIAIKPSSLATPENFYDSTANIAMINALKKTIFSERYPLVQSTEHYPDSRFLILLKKKDLSSDTVVYLFPKIYYNSHHIFSYSFNVLDSILAILHKDRIDCQDEF